MTPSQLSALVVDALTSLVEEGALTLPGGVPAEVTIERPRQKGHGDYATNVALQLAKAALVKGERTNPRALGELLAAKLEESGEIQAVEVAGPGFLNVTVEAGAQGRVAADIVAAGAGYGHSETLTETSRPDFGGVDAGGAVAIDADAHVRLAHPDFNDGTRILRRGYNFVDGNNELGRLDAGLFFLSYQRSPAQFVSLQRALSTDLLNEYLRHVGSGIWAIPRGAQAGSYVGAELFA